jgi:hypothetical protein
MESLKHVRFSRGLPNFSSQKALMSELGTPRSIPTLKTPQFVINAEQGVASEFHKRLTSWIQEFDASLDDAHFMRIRLVNFGQAVSFHLEKLGYWDPYLISFSGITEDGNPVELIQHVNQISVLLMKVARKNPTKPKQPIGFNTSETT